MADEKLKFDKWQQVEEAVKKTAVEGETKGTKLVIALIAQSWNPTSVHVFKELEKIRKTNTFKAPIFVIDHDDEKNKTWELSLAATPALIFYIAGKPLTVRRTDFADDDKFVGSCTAANLLEMLQAVRSVENEGGNVLTLNF